ncbi:MAG: hypothetical protein QOF65_2459 [Thermoleophilaceae bacterium]|jgi:hypothetical protein|nr:hypothetical protein [Thermoleophilaceae bacterium]
MIILLALFFLVAVAIGSYVALEVAGTMRGDERQL